MIIIYTSVQLEFKQFHHYKNCILKVISVSINSSFHMLYLIMLLQMVLVMV